MILVFFILSFSFSHSADLESQYLEAFNKLQEGPIKELVKYGKTLFDETPLYIGPKGRVGKFTGNQFTCKNCHLDSGLREFGLQLTDSHGLYPRYRARESKILSLAERINSCIRMPMVGKNLPIESKEMQAFLIYLKFIGQNRVIRFSDKDDRLLPISYPNTAASPQRGEALFKKHCIRCHGNNGEGQFDSKTNLYKYPPIMGMESYRVGSSMHRPLIFARFIKGNMPFDKATPKNPLLTDKEALDIAVFVNNERVNKRPKAPKNLFTHNELKPIDYPIGPFADPFPPDQHRFGPFSPIKEFHQNKRKIDNDLSEGDLVAP